MNTLVFLVLMTFVSGANARGNSTPKEEDFILPKNSIEACKGAREIIEKKKDRSETLLLKGSREERYLENLVRICSGLPLYHHSSEIIRGGGGIATISEEGDLFRLQPALVEKIRLGSAVQSLKGALRIKWTLSHGPVTELKSLGYCRIETAQYLEEMSGKYNSKRTRRILDITSAFRSGKYQDWLRLQKRNGNAIPIGTATGSTHATLATVDIGYKNLSLSEQASIERILAQDERNGRIQATKEWSQMVYHVMVFPKEFFQNSLPRKTTFAAQ